MKNIEESLNLELKMNVEPSLMDDFELIAAVAEDCKLMFDSIEGVTEMISKVSEFLEITPIQTILLATIAELSFQKTATIEVLARYFDCSALKILSAMDDIEQLEKKGYVRKNTRKKGRQQNYSDVGYSVPSYVIDAIRKADRSLLGQSKSPDLPTFLKSVSDLADERAEGLLTSAELFREVEMQIIAGMSLPFVHYVNSLLMETSSKCTVFLVSFLRLKERFHVTVDSLGDLLFDNFSEHLTFDQEISDGGHELIKSGLLRNSTAEFETENTISLTEKTVKKLYQGFPSLLRVEPGTPGIISHGKILPKKLYFDGDTGRRLKETETLIMPSRFKVYCRELRKRNFKMGVTIMFSGEPGTGKTEAVYQMARRAGRDIMMVDLSQTKSKWFGESEKIVKQIFIDYETIRRNSDVVPILFINEADGLFGIRSETNGSSSTTDQVMNTIQNILLQALEGFEGIMVVTTNLKCNFDRAFERRFTFRIEFNKPDAAGRRRIWKSKLPELTPEEAGRLAERFELTGGEIDVHVKKVLLRRVLDRKSSLYRILEASCGEDKGFVRRTRVGYRS